MASVCTNLIQSPCQILCPVLMRNIPISRMILEKLGLRIPGIFHAFVCVNVLLAAVHATDEAEFEGVDTASKDVESVSACIHQVEFGQDSDCAAALRIDCTREFEGIGVSEVDVGRRDCENYAALIVSFHED